MKLSIRAQGLLSSPELEEFTRVQVAFATWSPGGPCRRARAQITRLGETGGHRCWLEASITGLGPVEAGATGETAWEAIQEAARLLEAACSERRRRRRRTAEERGARSASSAAA